MPAVEGCIQSQSTEPLPPGPRCAPTAKRRAFVTPAHGTIQHRIPWHHGHQPCWSLQSCSSLWSCSSPRRPWRVRRTAPRTRSPPKSCTRPTCALVHRLGQGGDESALVSHCTWTLQLASRRSPATKARLGSPGDYSESRVSRHSFGCSCVQVEREHRRRTRAPSTSMGAATSSRSLTDGRAEAEADAAPRGSAQRGRDATRRASPAASGRKRPSGHASLRSARRLPGRRSASSRGGMDGARRAPGPLALVTSSERREPPPVDRPREARTPLPSTLQGPTATDSEPRFIAPGTLQRHEPESPGAPRRGPHRHKPSLHQRLPTKPGLHTLPQQHDVSHVHPSAEPRPHS